MEDTKEQIGLSPVPEELSLSETFGTIVNNQPAPSTEWDERTKELETPLTVTMKLPTSFVARLQRVADESAQSLDDFVTTTLKEHLDGKVGGAVIKGPSFAKGAKIRGFTGSVTRA